MEKEEIICGKCGLYLLKTSIIQHNVIRHKGSYPIALYICSVCGAKVLGSSHFTLHKKTHDNLCYICSCKARFLTKDGIINHLNKSKIKMFLECTLISQPVGKRCMKVIGNKNVQLNVQNDTNSSKCDM